MGYDDGHDELLGLASSHPSLILSPILFGSEYRSLQETIHLNFQLPGHIIIGQLTRLKLICPDVYAC